MGLALSNISSIVNDDNIFGFNEVLTHGGPFASMICCNSGTGSK